MADKNLPSSKLLKHLLSEPINSWRRLDDPRASSDSSAKFTGKLKNADSDAASVTTEDSLDVKPPDKNEENGDKCFLKPGLITKPPLPKKLDLSNRDTNRSESNAQEEYQFNAKYNGLFQDSSPSPVPVQRSNNRTDLEKIESVSKNNPKETDVRTSPVQVVDTNQFSKDTLRNAIMEDSELRLLFYGNFEDDQKSIDGLSSASELNVLEKNWELDDNKMDKEVYMNEKQTDLLLDKLKRQQEVFGENAQAEKSKELSKTDEQDTDEKFRKFFEVRPEEKSDKHQNEENGESLLAKSMLKNTVTIRYPKPSLSPCSQKITKPTFTPRAMKPKKDFLHEQIEEDSWISKYGPKESNNDLKNKNVDKWVEDSSKIAATQPKQMSYNDVLENLEELEEETVASQENHGEDQVSSGTVDDDGAYQDMVSILQDLEDAGKVSRKLLFNNLVQM